MNGQGLLSAVTEAALSNPGGASEPTFLRSLPARKFRAVLPDRVFKVPPCISLLCIPDKSQL